MLKNYFKIALRNLINQKLNSFITIFGLAFGMACFLMMFNYIQFERSYDDFHTNGDNIYRLDKKIQFSEISIYRSMTGVSTGPLLREEFPAIKNTVRFANLLYCLVSSNKNVNREKRFLFADSSVFSMFSFRLKTGNPNEVLSNPFSVVITPKAAEKYFGNLNPLGKTLFFQTKLYPGIISFTVTGVTKEIPSNSTIKFDFLASFSSLRSMFGNKFMSDNWEGPVWTYVQIQNNYDPKYLESLFPAFAKKYIPKGDFNAVNFRLTPLKNTYYEKGDGLPLGDWGIKPISYIVFIVSILVLLIACLNYANLLSARSVTRVKEIGVRKVQGATRFQLISQFIGESIIISFISLVLSVVLYELFVPFFEYLLREAYPSFNIIAKREVNLNQFYWSTLMFMFFISVVIGIISGIYPAIVLSRHNISDVIKGEMIKGKSSSWFRKILVVLQFAVSSVFIIVTLHIILQLYTWNKSNPGFDKDNLMVIPVYDNSVKDKYQLFKNELMNNSNILGVTSSNLLPIADSNNLLLKSDGINDLNVVTYFVDQDFIKTLKLKIVGGKDFTDASVNLKSGMLMNRAAMKACGWNEVNGQKIQLYTKENNKITTISSGNLIGVTNNFRYRFDKAAEDPLILKINTELMNYILIRINKDNFINSIKIIKEVWGELQLNQSFKYSYFADELTDAYSVYNAMGYFIQFGSFITLIIAVMGLFALSTFIINRKTKEIGIRKVLGASIKDLILTLSRSFILLVIIGELIALPISYKLVPLLLGELPNHIELDFWLFLYANLFLVILSCLVIGLKALNATISNPINSLRYE